mgnify:CR=1 FL=1
MLNWPIGSQKCSKYFTIFRCKINFWKRWITCIRNFSNKSNEVSRQNINFIKKQIRNETHRGGIGYRKKLHLGPGSQNLLQSVETWSSSYGAHLGLLLQLFLLMTSHFWELRSSEASDDIGPPKDWHYCFCCWYRVFKNQVCFLITFCFIEVIVTGTRRYFYQTQFICRLDFIHKKIINQKK